MKSIRLPLDQKTGIGLSVFLGDYLKDSHNHFLLDRRIYEGIKKKKANPIKNRYTFIT